MRAIIVAVRRPEEEKLVVERRRAWTMLKADTANRMLICLKRVGNLEKLYESGVDGRGLSFEPMFLNPPALLHERMLSPLFRLRTSTHPSAP